MNDSAYYTVILSNPDDFLDTFYIKLNPIVHEMVGNILGSDLKLGDLSNGDTVIEYFPPNSPQPFKDATFVYLIYEQTSG